MTFQQLLEKYREYSFSQRDKGDRFERIMQAFLQTAPIYAGQFRNVWLWRNFPFQSHIGGKDTGIDMVAQTFDGEYWAIQCKCYEEKARIDKPAVDSFLATSSKQFVNDQGQTTTFAKRLWISTTNNWGGEAERAIKNQNPEVIRSNLADLIAAPVDWDALENGAHGANARTAKKTPLPHQEDAIKAFNAHFQNHDRGKLIMACGTGKTFASLKIAERETGGKGLVLFLVPSIALIGQTLREWTAEADSRIFPICVCSDPAVSQSRDNEDAGGANVIDLAFPASTKTQDILRQLQLAEKYNAAGLTVVFSTYQSIEVIAKAQKEFAREFDLIICDEAHRTTGVTLKGKDESAFVKVHDNDFIKAKKRLYMTATPRLYHEAAKKKAEDADAVLCSMDDAAMYGEEVFRVGFGEAVDKKLLADYKVLVLTLSINDIPDAVQKCVADKNQEISTDDAGKLIGCINALSKRMLIDEGLLKASDPEPMRKAVAFCQSIRISKKIANVFNNFKDVYYDSLTLKDKAEMVGVCAEHVDGTMPATERDKKLAWLNAAPPAANECRILANVRCLSEGVDVPSLDAVLFLSAKDSQIDVVQSVGRVMRNAPNKKYGYIIIPILTPVSAKPEEILNDNERFKVLWRVLAALRAHDDRFSVTINRIDLNDTKPADGGSILVGGIQNAGEISGKPEALPLPLPEMRELHNAIYARMVQKVGERRYWEQWAKDVAQIAQGYIERINRLIAQPGPHKDAFDSFLATLRQDINPAVTADEVVEMLAQHYITKPIFEALFANYSFVKNNPVSQALQAMLDLLEAQALEKDAVILSRFYESVKRRVADIDNARGRQKVITELYDKFFRTAFPLTVEKLGIVYTPVEIVDFINQSVADILLAKFGCSIADAAVNILDPFAGTGTFIARLIERGLVAKSALPDKYQNNLFANEIVLLAYYIASINIENAYQAAMGKDSAYKPFPGICLTDTFQLGEDNEQTVAVIPQLKLNFERVQREQATQIQVIVGNPPYSIGQKSANDDAQNQKYENLEKRINATYAARGCASSKKPLYDSYIKAFRWASDRIDKRTGGIIAFVSNAGWLDGNAMDGMRKCFEEEFSDIYVFNLRGNQRTSGELSRREGGKIFGSGSRTPIAITILVKHPEHDGKAIIHYHDIGDYLARDKKMHIISAKQSVLSPNMDWEILHPDKNGDWINKGNSLFEQFIAIADKKDYKQYTFFKSVYSLGLNTNRDVWCYNFSKSNLECNIKHTLAYYNHLIETNATLNLSESCKDISWSSSFDNDFRRKNKKCFNPYAFFIGLYRPWCKENVYFDGQLNHRVGQLPQIFPTPGLKNCIICVSGLGSNQRNGIFISNCIVDLNSLAAGAQCFPLYYYEKKQISQPTLFDAAKREYIRKDAITDFILARCHENYGSRVTKEDIFYYVYGLLHSPDYRQIFAADLKKSLPRLPLVDRPADFWAFSKAGRDLANLHLNYEVQPPCQDVIVEGVENGNFHVEKMRYPDKNDKSAIQYNPYIKISNIPLAAYDYVVNGRSAIDWIMERYQIKTDKTSGIVNDPNDWAKEHGKPRYILDLLMSVITVSLETMKIVDNLPKLDFAQGADFDRIL